MNDAAGDDRDSGVVHGRARRDQSRVQRRGHGDRLEGGARLVLVGDDFGPVQVLSLRVVNLVGREVVSRVVGCRQDVARARLHDQDQATAGLVGDDRLVQQPLRHALDVAIDRQDQVRSLAGWCEQASAQRNLLTGGVLFRVDHAWRTCQLRLVAEL